MTIVASWTHPDGHIYPPMSHTMTKRVEHKRFKKVPQSERPALFYRLPTSHELRLKNISDNPESVRYGLAGFIIHFLAFLYGYRCHFYDWWIEGRIKISGDTDYSEPRLQRTVKCLDQAIDTWARWNPRQQTIIINAIYLHTRTCVYEQEWERFQAEYQVADAIFALAQQTNQIPPPKGKRYRHDERIPLLCKHYGLACDQAKVDTMVKLRNDLLHEALWDGRMPGESRSHDSFYASHWLHKLSRRAMLAVLGLSGGEYIYSPWWSLSQAYFDVTG